MRTPKHLRNLCARTASKLGTLLRSSRAKESSPLKPRRCQLESLEARMMLTGTPADPDPFVAQEVASAIGESGTVTVNQANAEQWHEVEFEREYVNPVVIMGLASRAGGQPMSLRVAEVTSNGFQWQMDEWSYLDGSHITETVGYIVVEAGTHTLDNGATLVAGTTTAGESFERVTLDAFESTPVVLTQISTVEDPTAAVTRVRRVTADGFEVRVQEEEASNNAHAKEIVGYIAIDVGMGTTGDTHFDVALTTDSVTHRNKTIEFEQDFGATPVFIAAMQTTDGGDTATVRYRSLNDGSATIFVEEEQSRDRERWHTTEVVGYFAIEAGLINAGEDPGEPPVDPPLEEPTVIDGVLHGTKGDDANLDANEAGVNSVFGDYGDDTLIASNTAGEGAPPWAGPQYGFDLPEDVSPEDFANILNGGHGNDVLQGSDLNDLLISRADGREPVIAQNYGAEDDPNNEIDPNTNTLYPDQPIEGDDILIGGGGADLFYFQTLLNAKEDIILKHVKDDGTINWNGVAGENNNVHDHWVDGLGDELIADFNREEGDHILIEGHTTEVYKIEYVDSDGDGNADSTVLHVWSNQGNGGGAHNKDLLGTITAANVLLTAEDFTVNKTNYGIVPTVAQLDEAITPYSSTPDDGIAPAIPQPVDDGEGTEGVVFHAGGTLNFNGDDQGHVEVEHNQNMELDNGTVAFSFSVNETGNWQALFSKDAHGQETGGHLTAFMAENKVKVRLQTPDRDYWLYTPEGSIEAGQDYHVAITFGADGYRLYLNGVITDANTELTAGISANQETLALGANIWGRGEEKPYFAQNHLDGTLSDFTIYDSQLTRQEIADLAGYEPEPELTDPTVIDGVLHGTKGDDANLDANEAGVNSVFGDYGDDTLIASNTAGEGAPPWAGPQYGFDLPEDVSPEDFANILNGGHGNDVLQGSDLNDLLISRADGREPVIAQNYGAEDDPNNEIDPNTNTLYPDQPIEGDDILIGGGGADLFYFQTLLNAKEDIILKHVKDDGTINWNGVAGENNNVHDHWVDGLGDELIADFNREEGDHILIEGHTTEVYKIEYVDSDGDGNADSTVLHVWSNQGNGGGAHNKDLLGTITAANVLLTAEDFTVNKTNYGIVPTVAQLDEAITPYSSTPDDGIAPAIPQPVDDGEGTEGVVFHAGGTLNFNGDDQGHVEVEHNQNMELDNGTVAFSFSVNETGNWQALFSKDAHGQETGGHLTAFMAENKVKVRLQTPDRDYWLYTPEGSIEAGQDYHVAITFGADGYRLYLNGVITDANIELTAGISANQETLALGANIWGRGEEKPYFAQNHLDGTLSDFTIYDSQLSGEEIADLAGPSTEALDVAFAELALA